MIKVHFHSDCGYFAGCENMLPPLFSKLMNHPEFQVTFSYRYSSKYEEGLRRRVVQPVCEFPRIYPNFGDPSKYPEWLPSLFQGVLIRIWALLCVPILMAYQVLDLFLLFRRLKPAVLHVNNGGYPAAPSARAAIIAGKFSRIPLKIMVVNNMAQNYRSIYRVMDYPVDCLVSYFTDVFITGSKSAMSRLIEILKLPQSKTIVIPNGIMGSTSSSVHSSQPENTISDFIGTTFAVIAELVPRKGHIYLFKAIATLRDSKIIEPSQFRLLVVGDGPLTSELKKYIIGNRLEKFVFFEGYMNDIYTSLEKIDVVVLPSIAYEDFPYVILEGMSMMKPIIGSRIAGIPEQIDHEITGLLVAPGNDRELAKAIEVLHTQPLLRAQMGRNGKQKFLANFTSAIATDNYMKLYSSITKHK